MGKRNIFYLTLDFLNPIFSGNGNLSRLQVASLLKSGFGVTVLCPPAADRDDVSGKYGVIEKYSDEYFGNNVPSPAVVKIPIKTKKWLGPDTDIKTFFNIITSNIEEITSISGRPDLIVAVDWHTVETAEYLADKFDIPYISNFFRVFTYNRSYIKDEADYSFIRNLEKKLLNGSLIFVLCDFDRRWAIENGAEPERVKVLYPPVLPEFLEHLTRLNGKVSRNNSRKIIGVTVSRLVAEKKITRVFLPLTALYDYLVSKGYDFEYRIYGEPRTGHYFRKITECAENTGASKFLRIYGRIPLEELIKTYLFADFYIHTSEYEPFGITIIEAAMCGCPIVLDASGEIGAGEYLSAVAADKNTIIPYIAVPYDNPEAFARTVGDILISDRAESIGNAAKICSADSVPGKYMEIFVNYVKSVFGGGSGYP